MSSGVHDERWIAAIRSQGFEPDFVLRTPHESDIDFRGRVARYAGLGTPIVAGPLDDVTDALIGLPRLVGLSWGFDLHRMAPRELARLRELTGLIVDSEATRAIAINAGVPAESIVLLPWGVDLATFTEHGPRWSPETLGLAPDTEVILSLRALESVYRVSDILEGFARIADLRPRAALIVGGTGSLLRELQSQAKALGIDERVFWIGHRNEAELPALLRRVNAYVSASSVDGTSVTLLQAMACGAPVVVSAIPGNTAWVNHRTGWQFQVANPASLASAVEEALDHGSERTTLARALVVREGNWAKNVGRLTKALGESE